jgi:zinc protease
VSLETLEAAVDAVVAELQDKGVDDLELARAKTRLIADTIYAQDNQATLARIYGASWATGLSAKDVREWPDRLKAVTADQVRDVARRYLVTDRAVTGYLKQAEPKAGDAGKADGKKDNRS